MSTPLAERVRLQARAWPKASRRQPLSDAQIHSLLQLPAGAHPRTVAWAQALRDKPEMADADARTLANAVLQHVRTQNYSYTLTPGTYTGDAVDEFWFDRRMGFCEHYAASFVIVMRAMGIPARIVTGYQGVDAEPQDGWWIVRQSHAHAWAEYWQRGEGWVRADPTAAVAPERVLQSRQLTPKAGLMMGVFEAVSPDLRLDLRRWVEAMDNRWNQAVLGYGRGQQFELLKRFGFDDGDWVGLLRLIVGLAAAAGLAGAGWAAWDARRQTPWQKLHAALRRELATIGIELEAHEAPGALAKRVMAMHGARAPAAAGRLAAELQSLEAQRYGAEQQGRISRRWLAGFRRAAGQLRAAARG